MARQQFFAEQANVLVRFGKLLPSLTKQRDAAAIEQLLSTYESVLFAMQLPVNVQVVILDAPQQLFGLLAELAPDEQYYNQILQQPQQLAYSQAYTKPAMPDYPIINYGLGILDDVGTVVGIVEAKISQAALNEYVKRKVFTNFHAEVLILACGYLCVWLITFAIFWYMVKRKRQYQTEIANLRACLIMHAKYDQMQSDNTNVHIGHVVNDVYAATNVIASAAGVTLKFPLLAQLAIYNYCNQKQLVQTLNIIVTNVLRQLGANGNVQLEVSLTKDKINFVFTDNGFYCELDTNWQDLSEYIEHVHTAYVGNRITYSIQRIIKNNVVSLEQYQDA